MPARCLLLTLLLLSCSTEEPTANLGVGLVNRDLTGDWLLTGWVQHQVGGSATANLTVLGGTGQLTVASDGHFRFELDMPGYPARVDSGTVVVRGEYLFWIGELVETTYLVTLRRGILTLHATDPVISTPPVPGGLRGAVLEDLEFVRVPPR